MLLPFMQNMYVCVSLEPYALHYKVASNETWLQSDLWLLAQSAEVCCSHRCSDREELSVGHICRPWVLCGVWCLISANDNKLMMHCSDSSTVLGSNRHSQGLLNGRSLYASANW